MIIQNSTVRLPIALQTPTGSPATGIVVGDIKNGVAQVIKSDGTTASIAISGTTWKEIDAVQSPGLYHLVVPNTATNLLGPLQYSLFPTVIPGAFNQFIGADTVYSDTATSITAIKAKTDLIPASPASTTDITSARDSIKGTGNVDLTAIAGTGFNSAQDALHQLRILISSISATGIAGAVWDEARNLHITNGSFGQLMRILYQCLVGKVAVDVLTHQLIIYAEDSTTVLLRCDLKDTNGMPSDIFATTRLQGV
jgi:hypothetical protein